jgi:hypothetical protein
MSSTAQNRQGERLFGPDHAVDHRQRRTKDLAVEEE